MTATARRDLQRIPPRIVHAIVEFVFGDLAAFPRRVGKPLQRELEGLFGARRGPYRILYSIDDGPTVSRFCASIIEQTSTEATDRDSRNTSARFKTHSALTAVLDELRPAI